MDWKTFWGLILGDMTLETFAAYTALMLAGAIIFFANNVRKGTKRSAGKFSWGYMFKDNAIRILSVTLSIMVLVIFYESFFGVPLNAKLALMQGLSIDAIAGTLTSAGKQSGVQKNARANLKKKYNA